MSPDAAEQRWREQLRTLGQPLPAREVCCAVIGPHVMRAEDIPRSRELGATLVGEGWTVVTGGGGGWDVGVTVGAMFPARPRAGARVVCVLPNGLGEEVDWFPSSNLAMLRDVSSGYGTLVSPFEDDEPPTRERALERCETIVRLSSTLIVTGGRSRSSAAVAAGHAILLGVPIVAIPGSQLTDALIAEGTATAAVLGESGAIPALSDVLGL